MESCTVRHCAMQFYPDRQQQASKWAGTLERGNPGTNLYKQATSYLERTALHTGNLALHIGHFGFFASHVWAQTVHMP